MVATFDYKGFAKDLTKEAEKSIPEDIALKHKKEFLDKIYNFTFIAGEAFSNDDTIESSDTAKTLTQLISEWTFHKYIDLLRSDIPEMYHESILQKLAYVAFEMGKESLFSNLSQEQMLTLVEVQVKKSFTKACKQLLDSGKISQEAYEKVCNLSNIDEYSSRLCHNVKIAPRHKSTLKYTVGILIIGLVALVVSSIFPESPYLAIISPVILVLLSMYIGFYIGANHFSK